MYGWLKPRIAIPVHGEAMHLAAHADFARELGVETVLTVKNGAMVRLAPAPVKQVDEIEAGRLYKDGKLIGDLVGIGVAGPAQAVLCRPCGGVDRRRPKGEQVVDPDVALDRPAGEGRRRAAAGGDRR